MDPMGEAPNHVSKTPSVEFHGDDRRDGTPDNQKKTALFRQKFLVLIIG